MCEMDNHNLLKIHYNTDAAAGMILGSQLRNTFLEKEKVK